jgi:hypothetical protein
MEGMTWIKGSCSMHIDVVVLLEKAGIELNWRRVKDEACVDGFYCPTSLALQIERLGGSPYYPARLELRHPA